MENINVCVRIKPRLGNNNDEQLWKYDMSSKSITNLKTKENFTFGIYFPNPH